MTPKSEATRKVVRYYNSIDITCRENRCAVSKAGFVGEHFWTT